MLNRFLRGLNSPVRGKTRFNSGGFRYPLEALTETTDYMSFTIVEYQPVKERSGGSLVGSPGSRRIGPQGTRDKATKILGSIILQMPSNIQDGNAVDYGDLTLARTQLAGTSNSVRGIVAGGKDANSSNIIDFFMLLLVL